MSSPWSRTPRRLASLTRLICLLISSFTYITHFATALASRASSSPLPTITRLSGSAVSPVSRHRLSPRHLSSLLPLMARCLSCLPKLLMPAVSPTCFCLSCVTCVTMPPALLRLSTFMPASFLLSSIESITCISLPIYINEHGLIVIQLLSVVLILV